MEPSIYSFSLCTALPLMLFFGFYFLFAKTPEKKIFTNYRRTRQTLWRGGADANPKTCCQTIHDCQKVVPLHYESEWQYKHV